MKKWNHKKMRNICILISFVLFFSVLCGCTSFGSATAEYHEKLWYKYATDYIELDELIFQNKIENAKAGLDLFKSRNRVEQSLLNTEQPNLIELKRLLRSSNPIDKKVALVNIMLRKNSELEIYEEIINILNSEVDLATKFYCYQCFNNLDKAKVSILQDDFLNIMESERLEGNIIMAMPTLVKIDSPRLVDLFIKYLSEGSPKIKQTACLNFSSIDKNYQKKIKSFLESKNIWLEFEK